MLLVFRMLGAIALLLLLQHTGADEELNDDSRYAVNAAQPPEPGQRGLSQDTRPIYVPDGPSTDGVTPYRRDHHHHNHRNDGPPEPGHRNLGSGNTGPPEPNQRNLGTGAFVDEQQRNGQPVRRHYQPPEPGHRSLGQDIYVPGGPRTDGVTPVLRDYDNVPSGPRTDRVTPTGNRNYDVPGGPRTDGLTPPDFDPNYDRSNQQTPVLRENNYGQPLNYAPSGPSTGPVYPGDSRPLEPGQTQWRRQDEVPGGPRTDVIVPPRRYRDEPLEPGRNRFLPDAVVVDPIGPGQTQFRPTVVDRQYEWHCDMRASRCRLENRANFVPFEKDYFLDEPALVLDISEAARLRHSVSHLNPVKTYNGARLVTKDYFPARHSVACLHYSFLWTGYVEKRMHILQRNRDDRCIYSEHSRETVSAPDSWKNIELQLDLSGGDSTFLVEFGFETPRAPNNIYNGLGKIAIRNFTIHYGYCRHNQAFECDLPI